MFQILVLASLLDDTLEENTHFLADYFHGIPVYPELEITLDWEVFETKSVKCSIVAFTVLCSYPG